MSYARTTLLQKTKEEKAEPNREQILTNDPHLLLMNRDRFDCPVKTINCEGMEKMGTKRLKLATLPVTHRPIQRMFTTQRVPDVPGKTQR